MPPLMTDILRGLAGSFFGTVGFAMLVHVPKRSWLVSGLIASMSYLLYWALSARLGVPDPMGIFIGSMFGSLTGQICARRMKIIGTVFMMAYLSRWDLGKMLLITVVPYLPFDAAKIGNGKYAVDDAGDLKDCREMIEAEGVTVVLEQDHDGDVDVTFLDLTAAYINN